MKKSPVAMSELSDEVPSSNLSWLAYTRFFPICATVDEIRLDGGGFFAVVSASLLNRALAALSYKTVPYFNRLYRPPKAEQSLDYDPAIDKVDTLSVVADDLGNSGGMQRDVQVQILVVVFC